ncbi:MAG: hypothetical protein AAF108_10075 [Planctomycetota bacterium]
MFGWARYGLVAFSLLLGGVSHAAALASGSAGGLRGVQQGQGENPLQTNQILLELFLKDFSQGNWAITPVALESDPQKDFGLLWAQVEHGQGPEDLEQIDFIGHMFVEHREPAFTYSSEDQGAAVIIDIDILATTMVGGNDVSFVTTCVEATVWSPGSDQVDPFSAVCVIPLRAYASVPQAIGATYVDAAGLAELYVLLQEAEGLAQAKSAPQAKPGGGSSKPIGWGSIVPSAPKDVRDLVVVNTTTAGGGHSCTQSLDKYLLCLDICEREATSDAIDALKNIAENAAKGCAAGTAIGAAVCAGGAIVTTGGVLLPAAIPCAKLGCTLGAFIGGEIGLCLDLIQAHLAFSNCVDQCKIDHLCVSFF